MNAGHEGYIGNNQYGGPPPPDSRSQRRIWLVVVVVVLVAAATSVAILIGVGRDSPPNGASASASEPGSSPAAALPPPSDTAPSGGSVVVVEQGLSAMKDGAGSDTVSYGIIVENTSTEYVALSTVLTIRITDGPGGAIVDTQANTSDKRRQIYAILPGQRIGIGNDTYVDRPGAVKFEVKVGASVWLRPDNPLLPIGKITATEIRTQREPGGNRVTITFTVLSEHQRRSERAGEAIFRNSSGVIVGGTPPTQDYRRDYPPGRSVGTIRPDAYPPDTDDSRTEVYLSTSLETMGG